MACEEDGGHSRSISFAGCDQPFVIHEELWRRTNTRLFHASIELSRVLAERRVGCAPGPSLDRGGDCTERCPPAPARVIEIGCGLGLPGLICCFHGADVTLADRDPVERLISLNAAVNLTQDAQARLEVRRLCHGEVPDRVAWRLPAAHVLASDVFYDSDGFDQILTTLHHLSGPDTKVWIAYHERGAEQFFLKKAVPHYFCSIEEVATVHLGDPGTENFFELVRVVVLSGAVALPTCNASIPKVASESGGLDGLRKTKSRRTDQ